MFCSRLCIGEVLEIRFKKLVIRAVKGSKCCCWEALALTQGSNPQESQLRPSAGEKSHSNNHYQNKITRFDLSMALEQGENLQYRYLQNYYFRFCELTIRNAVDLDPTVDNREAD
eukprot:1150143-Pelagomonas_calceolata.AAC.4